MIKSLQEDNVEVNLVPSGLEMVATLAGGVG